MVSKTKFSRKEMSKILFRYNLGKLVSLKPFVHGVVQTNILLSTTTGKYAFRYYEHRSKQYVLFELRVLDFLSRHNYPCAHPKINKEKKLLGRYNGKYFAIFDYIKGGNVRNLNIEQQKEMVKWLAKLHSASKKFVPRYNKYREMHDEEYCRETIRQEAKTMKSKKLAEERIHFIKKQLKSINYPKKLSKGIVHSDYDSTNIKFVNNKLSGVLDFDDACFSYLVYDISSIIINWAWKKEKKLNYKKIRFLLNEYKKYKVISKNEINSLYSFMKLNLLVYASWALADTKKNNGFDKSRADLEYLDKIGEKEFYKNLEK